MKTNKIESSINQSKESKLKDLRTNKYKHGVTKKLLEKYKPNNSIARINNGERRRENERAA